MRALAALLLLAGCSGGTMPEVNDSTATSRALDRAAVASGQLADPRALHAAGAYGAATDIGEDRACVVEDGSAFKVGLLVAYGTGGRCVGRGRGVLGGGRLRMTLARECKLEARIDADGLTLPGDVTPQCQSLCSGRASWAGVVIPKEGDAAADALAQTDGRGRSLCSPT